MLSSWLQKRCPILDAFYSYSLWKVYLEEFLSISTDRTSFQLDNCTYTTSTVYILMVGYSPLLVFRANRLPDLLFLVAYLSRPGDHSWIAICHLTSLARVLPSNSFYPAKLALRSIVMPSVQGILLRGLLRPA